MEPSGTQAKRVFVGNLAYGVRWQELKDFMRQAGEVVHADVLTLANGDSRGCGIVEYSTAEEAQHAVNTLNDEQLHGRPVHVREDREPVGTTSHSLSRGGIPNAIFVGNLPFSTSWQDLKDLFRDVGTVIRADVHTSAQGRSRGRGTVVFETPEAVQAAVTNFNGYLLDGRAIEVRKDLPLGERPTPPAGVTSSSEGSGSSGSRSRRAGPANATGSRTAAPVPQVSRLASASSHGPPGPVVHLANLSYAASDADVLTLGQAISPVAGAEIHRLADGRPAGTAAIEFASTEAAQQALVQLNGHVWDGLKLVASYARFPPA